MTIHWKAVEQCFTAVLADFTQFLSLENVLIFGLGAVMSERVKWSLIVVKEVLCVACWCNSF